MHSHGACCPAHHHSELLSLHYALLPGLPCAAPQLAGGPGTRHPVLSKQGVFLSSLQQVNLRTT